MIRQLFTIYNEVKHGKFCIYHNFFKRKGGAKVAPLVIALVLLVVLAGYMGVIVYQLSVVRI